MAINDLTNDYANATGRLFGAAPKTVWAAIAYSLALRLSEDGHAAAIDLLKEEWAALHANGIVPQKPAK
jgi:hypothetical protein